MHSKLRKTPSKLSVTVLWTLNTYQPCCFWTPKEFHQNTEMPQKPKQHNHKNHYLTSTPIWKLSNMYSLQHPSISSAPSSSENLMTEKNYPLVDTSTLNGLEKWNLSSCFLLKSSKERYKKELHKSLPNITHTTIIYSV